MTAHAAPSDDLALLLLCARVEPGPEARQQAERLMRSGSVDWDAFLRRASEHGLAPLLRQTIQRHFPPDAVPQAVRHALEGQYFANSRRNLLLSAELRAILASLSAEGVWAIPYKGVALAESVYGNAALRYCSDLDLLADIEDIPRVESILTARGYKDATRDYFDYHSWMVREKDGLLVEVHWAALAGSFHLPILDEWVATADPQRGLAPEANLLCLCAHGTKHLWERLGWVCDVAELIRREPSLNWAEARRQARSVKLEKTLLAGVLLARELLDAPLPPEIERAARRSWACRWMVRTTREALFAGAPARHLSIRLLAARFLLSGGIRAKKRAAAEALGKIFRLTLADRPGGSRFAGALLRPFRLVKTYWRALF